MPWYTSVEGDSMLSMPNGSLYLTEGRYPTQQEGRGAFTLEYRAHNGCVIKTWVVNVPSLYEARRLSMDMVRNYLLSEVKYLETTNPTVGVEYSCNQPTGTARTVEATYSGCGKVSVGPRGVPSVECSKCHTPAETPCRCKRVQPTLLSKLYV